MSRCRRRIPLDATTAVAELPVRDPDLVALWPTNGPQGREMLALLQRARDHNRNRPRFGAPSPGLYERSPDATL